MGSVRKTITVANQRAQERNAELKDIRSALEDGESSGPLAHSIPTHSNSECY